MKFTNWFKLETRKPLGLPHCPYAYRWMVMMFGFSVRLHKWIRSDDKRYMHDHPGWFFTLVLKGQYTDVTENGREVMGAGNLRWRSSRHAHYVQVDRPGTWTLMFWSPKFRNWGFWVDGKFKRPLKYFHKYGHPPCEDE